MSEEIILFLLEFFHSSQFNQNRLNLWSHGRKINDICCARVGQDWTFVEKEKEDDRRMKVIGKQKEEEPSLVWTNQMCRFHQVSDSTHEFCSTDFFNFKVMQSKNLIVHP